MLKTILLTASTDGLCKECFTERISEVIFMCECIFSCIIGYSFRWRWTHMFMSLADGVMVFIAVCLWTTVQQDTARRENSCCYTSILYYRKQLTFFGFVNFVCQASNITTRHMPSSYNFKWCSHSLCWTWGPDPLNQRCSALLQGYTPN